MNKGKWIPPWNFRLHFHSIIRIYINHAQWSLVERRSNIFPSAKAAGRFHVLIVKNMEDNTDTLWTCSWKDLRALRKALHLTHWIKTLTPRLGNREYNKRNRSCVLEDVLWPLLWSLVVDDLLRKLNQGGVYAQGFGETVSNLAFD